MEKEAPSGAKSASVAAVKQCRRKMEGLAASLVQIVKEVIKRSAVLDTLEREMDGGRPHPDGEGRTLLKKKSLQTLAHIGSDLEEYASLLKVSGQQMRHAAQDIQGLSGSGREVKPESGKTPQAAQPDVSTDGGAPAQAVGSSLGKAADNFTQISEAAQSGKETLEKTSAELSKVVDKVEASQKVAADISRKTPPGKKIVANEAFVERASEQLDQIARTMTEKTEDIDETAEDLGEMAALADSGRSSLEASVENLTRQIESIEATEEIDRLKYQFIARVSHDLRTPLTSILGAQSLLKSGVMGKLPEGAEELLEMTERNANRFIELINDILDLERVTREKAPLCMRCETEKVVEEAMEMVGSYANEQGVEIKAGSAGGHLYANEIKIVQVLVNLLGNAIKFSTRGSVVEITWEESDTGMEMRVSDRGPGVEDGEAALIFEPFYQIERQEQSRLIGSGLGLAICKSIVEQHGGRIGVQPRPGGGSIFWFKLPCKASVAAIVPIAKPQVRN